MNTPTPDIALGHGRYPHVEILFDALSDGIVYQNAAGHITTVNASAQRILGLSLEQMRGLTLIDPRWRAIRGDASALLGSEHPVIEALATGQSVLDVTMGVFDTSSEDCRWRNVCAYPVLEYPNARPQGVYAVFEDITEQKQLHQNHEASELRTNRGSTARAGGGMVTTDRRSSGVKPTVFVKFVPFGPYRRFG